MKTAVIGLLNIVIFQGLTALSSCKCELYTSVEELWSNWSLSKRLMVGLLEKHIQIEESKLNRLHELHELFLKTLPSDITSNVSLAVASNYEATAANISIHVKSNQKVTQKLSTINMMQHPVGAFVTLNKLTRILAVVEESFEDPFNEQQQANNDFKLDFEELKLHRKLPSSDDLIGCGEALLRLYAFYNLSLDHLIEGKLVNNNGDELVRSHLNDNFGPKMDSEDCFELGKIAYETGSYTISINLFHKALLLMDKLEHQHYESYTEEARINEILEYMAFAAYKNKQLKYSTQLTRLWLERDPGNERAKGNLEYYEEELNKESETEQILITSSDKKEEVKVGYDNANEKNTAQKRTYSLGEKFSPTDYEVSEDDIVRDLCQLKKSSIAIRNDESRNLVCLKRTAFDWRHFGSPELKIEILNSRPKILRVYDIISVEEATHLRTIAMPKLQRSTVQTKSGLVTTNFRIAKTAWLSSKSDLIVEQLDQRLAELFQVDMHNSEDLQVVNYGLGGFYGPHLDSARESSTQTSYNSSVPLDYLKRNDRMATILIYLNQVLAGGATVFPKLGLSVEPIERSAVIWFNLLQSGLSDERTLHTGCPVLLGSKWIATKWPREEANTFLQPCTVVSDE